jgi:curved DNA-binding protein
MTTVEARRILGVAAGCDAATLRAAFNAAVKHAHPDGGGSDAALRACVEAYRFLDGRLGVSEEEVELDIQPGLPRLEITPTLAVIGGRLITRLPDGRRVAITLPAGLRQGDQLSASGVTMAVMIKGRPEMFVSGDDLCLTVRTTEQIMRDGGRIKIKTPAGVKMLWVSRQVGTNHIVSVPGMGLPATRRHAQGAMVLKLVASTPVKPTKSQVKRKGFAANWATGGSR